MRREPGNARAVGQSQRRDARTGFYQQAIAVTVIAAVELDDALAPGESARQTDRSHRGFGARIDETNLLDGRNKLANQFGEFDLALGRRTEGRSDSQNFLECGQHFGRAVTEQQRTPRADVIDVFLPSASQIREPSPRAMKSGLPPTERKARTGEFTPPGMRC